MPFRQKVTYRTRAIYGVEALELRMQLCNKMIYLNRHSIACEIRFRFQITRICNANKYLVTDMHKS
jgi:hypothetical protein